MARTHTDISNDVPENQPDGELARRAANGDVEAFEELYRRHAQAAFRVAQRVTGNAHDAADAVSEAFTRVFQALPEGKLDEHARIRPYVMSAARNAAIDLVRRAGRTLPAGSGLEPAQTMAGPSERLIDGVDSSLVAAAFRALPERWRSVLWLTEVEQIPAREAARLLGLSPNGAAQLAVRARAGLRDRFLQAHLGDVPADCRSTAERLGAYVGGGLSPRDVARVDQHLAGCDECRAREAELRDLGTTLRKAVAPLGIGVSGLLGKAALRLSSLAHGGAERLAAPVAAAAAGVLALGLGGAAVVSPQHKAGGAPRASLQRPARGTVLQVVAAASATHTAAVDSSAAPVAAPVGARTPSKATSSPVPTPATATPGYVAVRHGEPAASVAPAPTTTTTPPLASHSTTTTLPTTTTTMPVAIPPVTVPTTIPPVTIPPVTVPTTLPPVTVPTVTIPTITLPTVPGLTGAASPAVKLPGQLQMSSGLGALLAAFQATTGTLCDTGATVVRVASPCDILVVLSATRVA
jgi:RNA polymerase sigma factor (sigma-70 family)